MISWRNDNVISGRFVRNLIYSVGLAAALPALSAPEVILYRGEPANTQNLQLGGWGSGYAIESQREYYSGTNSLEIHTDGYYAGGRIDFTPALNLTDAFLDPNTYLVFMVRFPALEADEGDVVGSVGPGRPPGIPPGMGSVGGSGEVTGPAVGYLRVLIVANGATLVAEDQPIDLRRTESGWTTIGIPLSSFKGPKPASPVYFTRLLVFGDRPDTFYIGEIRTTVDNDEIVMEEPPEEQTVSPGDPMTLTARANGGLANLEYVWDFDKSDGLQEDAFGETVNHSWPDAGDYVVTLRVRDINGIKPEYREEFVAHVAL
jgi:hypothetical protein